MTLLALVPLGVWLVLLAGRGMYWLFRERDDDADGSGASASWPSVTAIVPARDEADVIARSASSLLAQDYPGRFRIILVDDQSTDGTADAARAAAQALGKAAQIEVVHGAERPPGWTGKLWAMRQGIARASAEAPDYYLFTDADIEHSRDNLRRLIARARERDLVLTSLMVKLECRSFAEKLLIPAFVYFFAMLFPFAWVADPARRTAAAAGGCMLVKRAALEAAGGLETIRSEIIDDCALARAMKKQGPIWLGLATRTASIRPYSGFSAIARMVSRSAYAQLRYSPLIFAATIVGMLLVYALPPALAFFAAGPARMLGALSWVIMAVTCIPILRYYGLSPLRGAVLPVIGALYTWFTFQSALQHWSGKGGMWKGRAQAMASP